MSTTKTPSLKQYPVCKDSRVTWIGRVPDHWEVGNLRYFTRSLDGARIPLSAEQRGTMQGTIPYWGANSVIDHVNDWTFNEPLVLIGEDGAPFQDPSRDVAFFVDEKVWVNNHIHVIRCGSRLNPKFFTYVLNTVDYTNFITGSTRDKLTQRDLGNIPIQVPLISEQAAIVRYLDDADQRIWAYVSAKERLIALLEEERQAVIHQAVTRGLDPNVRLKPSGVEWLGDVPEHWEVRKLKQVCSQKAQYGANIPASEYTTSGIRFLRTTDITADGAVVGDGVYISRDLSPECLLSPGDILLTRSGATIGQSFLYDMNEHGECSFAGYLVRFSPSPGMLPKFVYLFTTSPGFQNPVQQSAIVSTIENVNAEKYANIQMPVPSLHEQTIIVRHLDELTKRVDLAIDLARHQIELIEEYRTRLIADVVTGKLDVREA